MLEMPADRSKTPIQSSDFEVNQPGYVRQTSMRWPKLAGLAGLAIFGGYLALKQLTPGSPQTWAIDSDAARQSKDTLKVPGPRTDSTAKGSHQELEVQRYAKQLADRNNVTIVGEPTFHPDHPMQLRLYSTSDGSTIMCSFKRVECFYNKKKPAEPAAVN
jgi:hypothetical protein